MDTPAAPVTPPSQLNKEVSNHVVMGILSYLGILVIIPYLMAKDVPFVKFHIKQGVVLVIIEIVVWALSGMFWGFGLWFIISLVQLVTFVLSVIGIVNVVQNKEKELPIVGSFGRNIPI